MFRSVVASTFHILFKMSFFRKRYFGFYKYFFNPYNLFNGVKKTLRFRNNLTLFLSIDDWIQQHIYFTGSYEENELLFIEKNLKTGNTFVDVGANIGLFSITASAIVGINGKVFSFEPFSTNYNAFKKNISINKINNITVEQVAIADKEQFINLYYDPAESNLGMVSTYAPTHSVSEKIKTTSLDSYFYYKEIEGIDMIKIDIEGGEYLALQGMKEILAKYKPQLIVEIDKEILKNTLFTESDIINYLATMGYKPFYIDRNGELIDKRKEDDNSMNVVFINKS